MKNRSKHLKIGTLTRLKNVHFGRFNTFYNNIEISNSIIDDFVYVADDTKISRATIGKFCSIGPNVRIGLGLHPTNLISTFPAFYSTRRQCQITFTDTNFYNEIGAVKIGNDVWIGCNSLIMDNITIGDGAIIAAGSVVTRNVEPYSVVGGVPARLIKKRFSDHEIKTLMEFRWWDREIEWIKSNMILFHDPVKFFHLIDSFV